MTAIAAPSPCSIILFGASGHLARIKIYPALYILALKKRLPDQYAIVGFARSEMNDAEFRNLVEESVRADLIEVNEKVLADFLSHVHYHQGQYDQSEDFTSLNTQLDTLEQGWPSAVRLAYLSIPPTVFTAVLTNLDSGGVHKKNVPFRCIVEKPVGNDLQSFEALKKVLLDRFTTEEIYLLDHYLGKEAVRNIYYLRLANPVLERLLKNTIIDYVELTAAESHGLEGRAGYFDAVGTFRDFFQSHLVLMAALLTMRLREQDDSFRGSRLQALEQLYLPPASDMNELVLQGQYGAGTINNISLGSYLQEEGVPGESRSNTFALLKLATRTSRWEGVPFFLRSGKRLKRKETRVSIQFQDTQHVAGTGTTRNRLDIILQGEAGMRFHLQTKVGGTEPQFRPLIMEDPLVCVGDCLPEHGLLLLEAMHGKQQWFLTFDEVRAAWRLLDPVQAHLDKPSTPLHIYESGSEGPNAMHSWIAKHNAAWL